MWAIQSRCAKTMPKGDKPPDNLDKVANDTRSIRFQELSVCGRAQCVGLVVIWKEPFTIVSIFDTKAPLERSGSSRSANVNATAYSA